MDLFGACRAVKHTDPELNYKKDSYIILQAKIKTIDLQINIL